MTSHDQLGHTRQKTGVWLEEFVSPYYVFKDVVDLVLASPRGGKPQIDPRSDQPEAPTPGTIRFKNGQSAFANTRKLAEEAAVGLTQVVPFLIEDMLKANGGNYSKAENWKL